MAFSKKWPVLIGELSNCFCYQTFTFYFSTGVFIIQICAFGTIKTNGIIFVNLRHHFQTSDAMTTSISMLQRIVDTVTSIAFSFLAERFGSRPIVLLGSCAALLAAISSTFAPSMLMFLVTYSIPMGLSTSLTISPSLQALPKHFNKSLTLAYTFVFVGASLGALVLPPLLQWAMIYYGFSGSFFILAAYNLQMFVGACLIWPTFSKQ